MSWLFKMQELVLRVTPAPSFMQRGPSIMGEIVVTRQEQIHAAIHVIVTTTTCNNALGRRGSAANLLATLEMTCKQIE
jgi:hypothetical protein